MYIIKEVKEIRARIEDMKRAGKTIGFVPTMGYLHKGHLTLMQAARSKCDVVVASIFVNPIQFGPNEDFARYPRDLERDCEMLRASGVDMVFTPTVEEMYPEHFDTYIEVNGVTDKLCGKSRPGHFRGVATVVAKLLNIVQPNFAFFGQKDAQQVVVINKMRKDLNMNVSIETVPIVREVDGLAMSSRNTYLSEEQRTSATVLYKSLMSAQKIIEGGELDASVVKHHIEKMITREPQAKVDYVEILSYPGLQEVTRIEGSMLIALAVMIGTTRLIDNIILEKSVELG